MHRPMIAAAPNPPSHASSNGATTPSPTSGRRWIRSKRRLSTPAWWTLAGLTAVVLLAMGGKLAGCAWLVDHLTLTHLGSSLTSRLGHLFIVPIGALVVVLLRMTFSLQTLGPFRAILLAMAFESVGFGLGLVFFAVVTAVVMVLRPATRHMGLPYYGRVLTIVSVVSGIVVLVLMIASASGAVNLERVAYFPIVVLALTGDASSRILAREGAVVLLYRFAVTLLAAAFIASAAMYPPVRSALLHYPELLGLQVVAIILVCELFDIRLFGAPVESREAIRKRRRQRRGGASETTIRARPSADGPLRVAVVRNRSKKGVLAKAGHTIPSAYSRKAIQRVLEGLRDAGFEARAFEGDVTLLTELASFLPVDPATGALRGVVLNLASGIQGTNALTHVPSMLEMAGVPYTGADPQAHALCLDRMLMKQAMAAASIPTPAFVVHAATGESIGSLEFPLMVKPRRASANRSPRLVNNRVELDAAVGLVLTRSRCDAIIESCVAGREFTVPVLGNEPVRTLPIVEILAPSATSTMGGKRCPARIDAELERRLRALAVAAVRACGTRDLARVDIRVDRAGEPQVIEVHAAPSLGWAGAYVTSARRNGYSFAELLREIVAAACARSGIATDPVAARAAAPVAP